MFRFTIRDVLWLTVVVAIGAGWWVSYRANQEHIRKLGEQVQLVERENDTWERRATSLRSDVLAGRKYGEVEFIPNGLRYVPVKVRFESGQGIPATFPIP